MPIFIFCALAAYLTITYIIGKKLERKRGEPLPILTCIDSAGVWPMQEITPFFLKSFLMQLGIVPRHKSQPLKAGFFRS
jgi:hypothetical protein